MNFGAPIFIISPTKRAGTNYLKNILCNHKDCFSPGPIWEDELLRKAHLLTDYVDFTFKKWNPIWKVEEDFMSRQALCGLFGESLLKMLHMQFSHPDEKAARFDRHSTNESAPPYRYVTKTPKSDNLNLFPAFFPNAYLLILIRDGRAVARSAGTSFAKPFDLAAREWVSAMEDIETFVNSRHFNPKLHRVVRYEDLVTNTAQEVASILDFVGLDPDRFDNEGMEGMPVIGSSTLTKEGTDVHWNPVEKTADFNPLARGSELGAFQQSHFAYLAGNRGAKFGYDVTPDRPYPKIIHALRAASFWPIWSLWRMSRFVKEDLAQNLKRMIKGRAEQPDFLS